MDSDSPFSSATLWVGVGPSTVWATRSRPDEAGPRLGPTRSPDWRWDSPPTRPLRSSPRSGPWEAGSNGGRSPGSPSGGARRGVFGTPLPRAGGGGGGPWGCFGGWGGGGGGGGGGIGNGGPPD